MSKKTRIFLPIAVIIFSIVTIKILKATKPEPEKKVEETRPLSLYVQKVARESISLNVKAEGEVEPTIRANVVSQVGGRVVNIHPAFIAGGAVGKGEVLVELDDTDYQLAIVMAKAQVTEAQLGYEQAVADADVAESQLQNSPGNHTALALKKPQLANAKARLEAAIAQLKQAKINLRRTRISLPFDGRIQTKQVDIGQFVSSGTQIGTAFSTGIAEVRLALADRQLFELGLPIGFNAGDKLGPRVKLSGMVAGKLRHWYGELVRIDAAIDPDSRLIYGYVRINDPYGDAAESAGGMPLAIGLYVEAEILGRNLLDAFLIPPEALRNGNQVYVVEKGKLAIREVEIIQLNDKQVVIHSGVEENDQVIVSPLTDPVRGMAIEPILKQQASSDTTIAMQAVQK